MPHLLSVKYKIFFEREFLVSLPQQSLMEPLIIGASPPDGVLGRCPGGEALEGDEPRMRLEECLYAECSLE
jgi:hypothetical protein